MVLEHRNITNILKKNKVSILLKYYLEQKLKYIDTLHNYYILNRQQSKYVHKLKMRQRIVSIAAQIAPERTKRSMLTKCMVRKNSKPCGLDLKVRNIEHYTKQKHTTTLYCKGLI